MQQLLVKIFCVVLLLFCHSVCEARGIWGSRRKRQEVEDNAAAAASAGRDEDLDTSFEAARRQAANLQARRRRGSISSMSSSIPSGLGDKLQPLLDMYLNMMNELIDSPDFDSMMTPETIQTMIQSFPTLQGNPELAAMLDSPQFSDPAMLKATIIEGVAAIRKHGPELIAMLNDPEKIMEMLGQLPPEMQEMMSTIMSGDKSTLKGLLDNLPGISAAQKEMLSSMLDGDLNGLAETAKNILSDPDQVEEARQQFLADPSMAEMMNIPVDVLQSKEKWAELMAKGMEQMMAGGGAEDFADVGIDGDVLNEDTVGGGRGGARAKLFGGRAAA